MYSYELTTKKSEEGNLKTTLRAKFRFKREVAPKDIEITKKRTDFVLKYQENSGYESLRNYLESKGFELKYTPDKWGISSPYFFSNLSSKEEIEIINLRRHILGIGFNFCTKTNCENISLEKRIDLEELNKFILSGKYNKK